MRFNKLRYFSPPVAAALGLLFLFPLSAAGRSATEPRELLIFTFTLPSVGYLTSAELFHLSPPLPSKDARTLDLSPPKFEPWAANRYSRPSALASAEKSLFTGTLISLVGLNIADYIATRQLIKKFGPEGVSPFTRPFAKSEAALAAFKAGSTLLGVMGLRDIHIADKPMAWALSLISNFLISYTLAFNLEQMEGAGNGTSPQR